MTVFAVLAVLAAMSAAVSLYLEHRADLQNDPVDGSRLYLLARAAWLAAWGLLVAASVATWAS